jgi:hypothetical protein
MLTQVLCFQQGGSNTTATAPRQEARIQANMRPPRLQSMGYAETPMDFQERISTVPVRDSAASKSFLPSPLLCATAGRSNERDLTRLCCSIVDATAQRITSASASIGSGARRSRREEHDED